MPRRPLSHEERERRRAEQRERLEHATDALLTSEGWRAWLRTRAVLHTYSATNTILLAQQAAARGMALSHVAGFRAWLRLCRCVRRGERGLMIYVPLRRRRTEDDTAASPVDGAEEREQREEPLRFGTARVFDVSQTDPLPGTEPAPLGPPRAPVDGDSHASLLPPLERFCYEIGYPVTYASVGGSADGYCSHKAREIVVSDKLSPNGRLATAIHEAGHALLGRDSGLSRNEEELTVEAVAFVVCGAVGLDTSCDSVPYIADWGGEGARERVRSAAERIDALARRIEGALLADPAVVPGTATASSGGRIAAYVPTCVLSRP
jgi:antirestriction protein ArdC